MTVVAPGKGRAVVEQTGTGLRITIPATFRPVPMAYLAFTSVIWVYVASHLLRFLLTREWSISTIALWMGFGALGVFGAYSILTLLWSFAGKEIIEIDANTLKRRKQFPAFSRDREYAVADISDLRLSQDSPVKQFMAARFPGWNYHEGAISFDYGRGTHQLGSGLDEADAKYVIGEMCKRVKSLGS